MSAIKVFSAVDLLEPHCPGCNAKVVYGVTTQFSDKSECHVCLGCGENL